MGVFIFFLLWYVIYRKMKNKGGIFMKFKKSISVAVVLSALLSVASCGGTGGSNTVIKAGNWPTTANPEKLELYEQYKSDFESTHPGITIEPDTFTYDTKTFTMKAAAKQLPNVFNVWFTETQLLAKSNYIRDVSDILKEQGILQYMNPELLDFVSDESGAVYGIPSSAYAQGLAINKKLFREAGLVDENGNIKVPQTYDELAEMSQTIREKTGAAGFVLPTTDNAGGWQLMNIAWSYGVKFMEEDANGKWKATFDSQEFRDTLQYLYDLRWKYNALPENKLIDQAEGQKEWFVGQAAMMFCTADTFKQVTKYDMNKDDLYIVRVPEGPAGRVSQMGGNFWAFSPETSDEQVIAAIDWLKTIGVSPDADEETMEAEEKNFQLDVEQGNVVLPKKATFELWVGNDSAEKMQAIRDRYVNVSPADFEDYYGFNDVIIKTEEPVCCQELYSVLDGVIQEILTNKNVDIDSIAKEAVNKFQVDYLDKQ